MCELFGVPREALPSVLPSSGRFGTVCAEVAAATGLLEGTPISGVAGDQQAALFGQACFAPGTAKNTYGTGSFVLLNVGDTCPPPAEGMLTTVAWTLSDGSVAYALEGAIFVTGAAVQWLRDGLGVISSSADVGPLADTVTDSGGVYLVPAFTGLGSPWWDPYARGTIVGITRGSSRAHLARAVVEAMAYQTRDAIDAMTSAGGVTITDLNVDGGASVMDSMLQFQADQLGVRVRRPADQETTALGAAYLAGLAEGLWGSLADIADERTADTVFEPAADRTIADLLHDGWRRAVERSRGWAHP
jgi:glycerol kinase